MKIYLAVIFIFVSALSFSQNINPTIRRGNTAYNNKKYKDAEIDYKSALGKDSKNFAANYNLGNAYYKQGNNEEAAKQFIQAIGNTKDPLKQSKAYYNLGNAYLNQEKYQESVDAYKMALRQNPNDEDARYNLAYALTKLKAQQNQNKNQQQKNQDQQKQQQQQQQQQNKNQDQKKDQQQKQDQQQGQEKKPTQPKISKEEAERMLQALKNQEQKLQKKNAKKFEGPVRNAEKDW